MGTLLAESSHPILREQQESAMRRTYSMNLASTCATLGLLCAQAALINANAATPGAASGPSTLPTPSVTTASAASEADGKLAHADRRFLKEAAHAGLAEIEASKLATGKASNAEVKRFAQQMIDDHTRVSGELETLAKAKDFKLPTEPSLADKAKLKVLGMRDGAGFDKHYIAGFGVSAHEDAVKLFQQVIREGKDTDIKAFATKTLPALQHHLEMARALKPQTDKNDK
jgi:putative membrane protein